MSYHVDMNKISGAKAVTRGRKDFIEGIRKKPPGFDAGDWQNGYDQARAENQAWSSDRLRLVVAANLHRLIHKNYTDENIHRGRTAIRQFAEDVFPSSAGPTAWRRVYRFVTGESLAHGSSLCDTANLLGVSPADLMAADYDECGDIIWPRTDSNGHAIHEENEDGQ